MAEELSYDVTARDRGATRTFGQVSTAMRKLEEHTGKLDDATDRMAGAQLKVRDAMLSVSKAEDGLITARQKLTKVTADSTSTDDDKRRASLAVEAAEVRHAKALRGVRTAGESAAKTARQIASAQRESEAATTKSSRAMRVAQGAAKAFGATARVSGAGAAKAYVGVSKSVLGVRVGVGMATSTMLAGIPIVGGLVAGMGMLTKGVYGAAANLQTLERRAQLVYGKAFPQMLVWGKRVGERAGMTGREVLGMTANFETSFKSMGVGQVQARQYSQQMLVVSAAVAEASAGQIDAAGAAEVVSAAFRGEYDSAQTLGIAISDTTVKAEALRMTNKKSADDLTDLEKAQAAYKLIMAGTTQQQALYAQGAGSLAAKQAQLTAKLGEAKDAVLVGLTPALTSLGNYLVANSDKFVGWAFNGAKAAITFGQTMAMSAADILDAFGDIAIGLGTWLRDTVGAFQLTGRAAGLLTVALGGVLSPKVEGALNSLSAMGRDVGQGMIDAGTKSKAGAAAIRGNVPGAADLARRKLEDMRRAALGLPPARATKVSVPGAAQSTAHLQAVKRAADQIPRVRTVSIQVNQVGSIQRIQREINSVTGKVVSIQVNRVGGAGSITGNATGTPFWGGGRTWVGERGPELVDLPRGSRVYDDARSRAMTTPDSVAPTRRRAVRDDRPRNLGTLTLAWPDGRTMAELLLTEERRGGPIKVSRSAR